MTVVVLDAARVGDIHANSAYLADFLLDNLKIQTNVIETVWRAGVRRRIREAAQRPAQGAGTSVTCWGTGTPLREFLHVDDLSEACVFALERWNPDAPHAPRDQSDTPLTFLNVGTGAELNISELPRSVGAARGFAGSIEWDSARPDGTARKLLDVSWLATLGWRARLQLAEALAEALAEVVAAYQAGLQAEQQTNYQGSFVA
jgi:GDP-L-fucose synthase